MLNTVKTYGNDIKRKTTVPEDIGDWCSKPTASLVYLYGIVLKDTIINGLVSDNKYDDIKSQ